MHDPTSDIKLLEFVARQEHLFMETIATIAGRKCIVVHVPGYISHNPASR